MATGMVAVVLSGAGVFDGTEIHEAAAVCAEISRAGKTPVFYAPAVDQHHTINHIDGNAMSGDPRNVLVESGRIGMGKVIDLKELTPDCADAVIFPGGFGAAKNLSTFGVSGESFVIPEVRTVLWDFQDAGKPIGMSSISAILAAIIFCAEGGLTVKMTLGCKGDSTSWPYAAVIDQAIEKGADVVEATVDEVCVDEDTKLVTTPAFMYQGLFHEVQDGVAMMVRKVLEMA